MIKALSFLCMIGRNESKLPIISIFLFFVLAGLPTGSLAFDLSDSSFHVRSSTGLLNTRDAMTLSDDHRLYIFNRTGGSRSRPYTTQELFLLERRGAKYEQFALQNGNKGELLGTVHFFPIPEFDFNTFVRRPTFSDVVISMHAQDGEYRYGLYQRVNAHTLSRIRYEPQNVTEGLELTPRQTGAPQIGRYTASSLDGLYAVIAAFLEDRGPLPGTLLRKDRALVMTSTPDNLSSLFAINDQQEEWLEISEFVSSCVSQVVFHRDVETYGLRWRGDDLLPNNVTFTQRRATFSDNISSAVAEFSLPIVGAPARLSFNLQIADMNLFNAILNRNALTYIGYLNEENRPETFHPGENDLWIERSNRDEGVIEFGVSDRLATGLFPRLGDSPLVVRIADSRVVAFAAINAAGLIAIRPWIEWCKEKREDR